MGYSTGSMLTLNDRFNINKWAAFIKVTVPDQHTADFDVGMVVAMFTN